MLVDCNYQSIYFDTTRFKNQLLNGIEASSTVIIVFYKQLAIVINEEVVLETSIWGYVFTVLGRSWRLSIYKFMISVTKQLIYEKFSELIANLHIPLLNITNNHQEISQTVTQKHMLFFSHTLHYNCLHLRIRESGPPLLSFCAEQDKEG